MADVDIRILSSAVHKYYLATRYRSYDKGIEGTAAV